MNPSNTTTLKNFFGFLVITLLFSCGSQPETDNFSSPKALFVDYISAYTSGVISNQSPIKVRLAKSYDEAVPGQEIDDDYFLFEPTIEGSAFWEDQRTIIFKPSAQLPSGKSYTAVFALNELFKTEKGKEKFNFRFATVPQNFDFDVEGYSPYTPEDLSKVKIKGVIVTADFAANERLEKMVTATQNNNPLTITWDHQSDNRHVFSIEQAKRAEQEEIVEIFWDGEPIGVEKEGEEEFIIPSINDFKVISVSLIRGEENYISVKFSDPIQQSQNLRGLISLRGISSNPRMVADLNEVKIYPSEELSGEVDIDVAQGIRNSNDSPLKKGYSTSITFEQTKPDVKIVANSGTIMPGHQNLILPFEAVSLNAVEVEVLQIFDDNVLQYLQVNSLGGTRELSRVGRKVAKKTISLKAMGVPNLGQWNRFTLDLSEIFNAEPGAIYQVNLNFSKKHSLYFCGTTQNDELSQIDEQNEEEESYEEDSYWDYYEEDYYYYTWEERKDPCSDGYYNHRSGKSKILLASDIGIIAKQSDGGDLHIITTQITSAKPQSEVAIEVYNYQQQKIAEGKTDSEGKAVIKYSGKPFAIVARKNNEVGYIKVDDGSSLSLSNFDVGGATAKRGIKGFIYGERGVWRPADTLHLSFILEDAENRLPEDYPVVMELYDPQGKLYQRRVSTSPSGKIYYFPMVTSSESPTGNWMAKVKAAGLNFQKQVKIETVKPNRLKINLDFGRERLTYLDKEMSGDLNVRWLHGAIAGNLKADFEVLLVPTKTTFKGYENVTFDDFSKEFSVENEAIFEGRLNSEGYARINFFLKTEDEAPGALNAIFKGKVFEEGGDFSIDKVVIPFYPYKSFVGVTTPEGDKRGMLVTDKDHSIRIVSVDAYGRPIAREGVIVEVYKIKWKWWWDNSYDNLSNYVGRESQEPIAEDYIDTENGEGSYTLNVKSPEWGRFYVKVTDPESGHSAGKVIYMDWPGWAGKAKRGDLGGATMLSFQTDKQEYNTGEKIKISFPSSVGGRALISLETGSRVLQSFWVDTEQDLTRVEFEATNDMAPTTYANITLLQPHAQTANDLPIRMYGIQPIKVVDITTKLQPVIVMDNELKPEQQFKVGVKEAKGKKMSYTIAIVDDGLLDLTKFQTPDPWSQFYSREALGVKTWDIYDDVIGSYGGQLERLLSVGGDDDIVVKDEDKANRFKPVVLFKGPFLLEPGKVASHSFKMPQYVGSVRTMVIAAREDAYGFADKTIPVKQPLMVLATLPRVAGPGERIKLPVNIFTMDKNIRDVEIQVSATGKLKVEGAAKKTINLNGSDAFITFDLSSSEALGIGKVKVTAKSGSLTANYDVELDIRASNPMMTMVAGDLLSAGAHWENDYHPLGIAGTNDAVIEVSTLPSLNLEQRTQFLIQYPHGCLEQTTSSVFPQLYLSELTNLDEKTKSSIEENIKAAINRLKLFQRNSGGFTYWPGNDDENSWSTNYAGHFLIAAKDKGYNVPEAMISSWKSFQKDKADQWSGDGINAGHNQLLQSYRLLTLAIAGEPALGAMNRMKSRSDIHNVAKWQLALAYALAGHKEEAKEMVEGITREVKPYDTPGRTYGSQQRDKAIILQTLIQLEREEEAFELVNEIAGALGDSKRWMSTQTTAFSLLAVADYARNFKISEAANVEISIDGEAEALNKNNFVTQLYLKNANKPHKVKVINKGEAPVYIRMIRRGIPLAGNEQESASNISLAVIYKSLDGQILDVAKLKQGTDFKAEITVHNPGVLGDYDELALSQIFPSGWEIINTRLDDTETYYQQDIPEYQDIRDDRVYTYFDLKANERKVFAILLNASYIGDYYLPGTSVEAMYDNRIVASKSGMKVQVVK